jgi:hypothetical protein
MEENKTLHNKGGYISCKFIRQKILVSLVLERLKIKEKYKNSEIKDYWCSKNITDHLYSEWCITVDPNDSNLENCTITTCCLPFKIILCLPCHIGAGINSILNHVYNTDNTDNTDKNYLF